MTVNSTDLDHEVDLVFVVPQLILFFIFILLGVVGNALLMLTVYKRYPLQRISYYLVSALATEDLLASLVYTTNFPQGVIWGKWTLGETVCTGTAFLSFFLGTAEHMFVTAITVDRYLACCWPLRYPQFMTVTRCKLVIAGCVLFSLSLAALPLCGCGTYEYRHRSGLCQAEWPAHSIVAMCNTFFGFVLLSCSITTAVCQYKILKQVRKVTHNAPPNLATGIGGIRTSENSSRQSPTFVSKAAKTVTLLTAVYAICWIPAISVEFAGSVIDEDKISILERITMFVFMVSKFANPIIYGLYNREFRGEFKKMWRD